MSAEPGDGPFNAVHELSQFSKTVFWQVKQKAGGDQVGPRSCFVLEEPEGSSQVRGREGLHRLSVQCMQAGLFFSGVDVTAIATVPGP